MRTSTYPFSQFLAMLQLLGVMACPFPAIALESEPHPLNTFLTNILNFREPLVFAAQSDILTKEKKYLAQLETTIG